MSISSYLRRLRGRDTLDLASLISLFVLIASSVCLVSWFDAEQDDNSFSFFISGRPAHRIRNSLFIYPSKLMLGRKFWIIILIFCMISFGYPLINMVTRLPVHFICNISWVKRHRKWVYFIEGMRSSVNLMLFSSLLFLTWCSYLLPSHGTEETDDTSKLPHLLTSNLVTLVVAEVLWALKTMLLLIWEAGALHERFRLKILSTRSHFFLFANIADPKLAMSLPGSMTRFDDDQMEEVTTHDHGRQDSVVVDTQHQPNKEKVRELKRISYVDNHPNLHEIKEMTQCFINLSKSFAGDDVTSCILLHCQKINPTLSQNYFLMLEDLIKTYNMNEDDAKILYTSLKKDHNQDKITYANFEESVVKAIEICVALGRTFSDVKEAVGLLSNLMNSYLLVIVSVLYLTLSNVATTKIPVLGYLPILAIMLMLHETYKSMFEGLVFLLIKHPIKVGDQCIIDGVKLEVKRMRVLSTTFIVTETALEQTWLNSILSSKPIITMKDEAEGISSIEPIKK